MKLKVEQMPIEDILRMSVADIRATTGLSQTKFAAYWHCHYRTIQNWEARGCPDYIKVMMARALGMVQEDPEEN